MKQEENVTIAHNNKICVESILAISKGSMKPFTYTRDRNCVLCISHVEPLLIEH